MPHSFSAAARVFCREAADHLPTISKAVAWPYISDPAIRSRSAPPSYAAAVERCLTGAGIVKSFARICRISPGDFPACFE
ncbi:hypothetical protein ACFFHJ_20770 [Planotetraspora thailandica]|nr:hypothetical protein [Planotetraspora thailandica]